METTILTTVNPITEAFQKLAKSLGDRKSLDYLIENYDQETLKRELVYFSKNYLILSPNLLEVSRFEVEQNQKSF